MAPLAQSLRRDPALAAMGLVPAGPSTDAGRPTSARAAARWRAAWISVALGVVSIVALFWGTAAGMAEIWEASRTFNHGFLVPLIVIYLIWIGRDRLSRGVPDPSIWGAALVAVMAFGWLVGSIASVRMVEQFAFIGMINGLFIAVFGWRTAWAMAFPMAYLLFAVPFGEFLIAPLQDLTAEFVVKALRIIGIPVYLEGIFLAIPNARFEVAEACAGVRFLIATLALGALFGHLTFRSYRRFAVFMLLSFVVPIIANWFRALGIVLIAHYSNSKYAVGADHIIYGWVFFSFVTVILLSIGMLMREKGGDEARPAKAVATVPAGSLGAIVGMAALSLAIASAAPAFEYLSVSNGQRAGELKLTLPAVGGGWRPAPQHRSTWRPKFPSADAEILQSYERNGRRVQFFIAFYSRQTQDREVINVSNRVADGKSWYRAGDHAATVEVDGAPVRVSVTRMLRGERGRLAMSWYWVNGRFTANPYIAKLLQVQSRIFGGPDAAALVAVSASYENVPREADALLRNFLSHTASIRQALEQPSRD